MCVGGAQTWALTLTEEPMQGCFQPGASHSLGEGPGSCPMLSPVLAPHKQQSSPRGDLVPEPRKAKLLI